METIIILMVVSSAAIVLGFFMGLFISKYISNKRDKKIMKNLQEVMDGKRENCIEVDGIKYHANRFRIRDEDGNENIVDLKGGLLKHEEENNEENNERKSEEDLREDAPNIRENSSGSGNGEQTISKEKRVVGRRAARRRYG